MIAQKLKEWQGYISLLSLGGFIITGMSIVFDYKDKIEDNIDTLARMEELLDKYVTIFTGTYIYAGILTGVNETYVELSDAAIVYETGELTSTVWKDAQKLPREWFIMKSAIESWGILNKKY